MQVLATRGPGFCNGYQGVYLQSQAYPGGSKGAVFMGSLSQSLVVMGVRGWVCRLTGHIGNRFD